MFRHVQRLKAAALGFACVLLLMAAARAAVPADHAKQMAAGLELFKGGVAALLQENCLECHGGGKTKGDFDLATREGLLKGGADGVSVVAGNGGESKLLKMLRHEAEPHMPSKKPRLPDDVIERITKWIEAGAPYAEPLVANAKVAKDRSLITEQDRAFWSFQPLKRVVPPSLLTRHSSLITPVDQFILAKQQEKGIAMNPAADRRVLIRRAYFDLIGLPPTPEEVEAFVADRDPKAYEKLVDRLLASPHYGERWGRHWLDLARFGESHGYEQDYDRPFAYHYRDFVIRALNDDLPFDTFAQWQIAGDELAPDNPQAWFATGFLGAGTHATQITANQAEKERYDELDDKISTIGTAFLGLTIGCARCHDHKYDPIPTKDYYRLIATFTSTVRSDHDVDLNPAQTRAALAAWQREHQPLVEALAKFEREQLPGRIESWLSTAASLPQPDWLWINLEGFRVGGGYYGINKSTNLADGSRLVTITAGAPDTMAFTAKTELTNIVAIRLDALADKTLPGHGPGWAKDGGFNLTEFKVVAKPLKGAEKTVTLNFVKRRATTDAEPSRTPLPWNAGGRKGRDHAAVFELESPAGFAAGTEFAFTLKFPADFDRNLIGRVRVSFGTRRHAPIDGTPVALKDFEKATAAFEKHRRTAGAAGEDVDKTAERGRALPPADREAIGRVFRVHDPAWRKLNDAVTAHAQAEPRPRLVKAMVCTEGLPAIRLHTQGPDFYDQTFLLKRGDLAQKQGEAPQGFLQVLMRTPDQEQHWQPAKPASARTPLLRTALAKWLTDVDEGAGSLVARVIVNRLWQHHLGRGIVATPSDFGATGDAPTHPELLDWLAGELFKNGWRLKPLHRLIMTSAVYQQGTRTDAARMQADPDNRLWWRRAPQRLEAEIIRDAVLAVSRRLDRTMFGPGTLDEGMKRRSVYFTIKRSKLIPMMVQFDWPDSLQSLGRRVNTTVAPQALLMMNNPQVRAAARDFAARLKPALSKSPAEAVKAAYATALGRQPDATELADAVAFLDASSAGAEEPAGRERALTDFCQTVFALNEFFYVE
jgi:mono/diheme cytochrome c family protein